VNRTFVGCVGAVLVATGAWLIASREPSVRPSIGARHATADDGPEVPVVSTLRSEPPEIAAQRAINQAAPAIDVERVRAAIDRLNEVGASITRAELEDEQSALSARIHEMSSTPVQEPEARVVSGQGRTPWTQLRFPSGEIRYEVSSDPETRPDPSSGP